MAIGRWLQVTAQLRSNRGGVIIKRAGTLSTLDCQDRDDLIWRGFIAACVALGRTPPNDVTLHASSDIPVARGLGSSAAAIVAGVLLANSTYDGGLDAEAIIDIAAALEGHPDNVAPSVLGGAVLSVRTGGHHYRSVRIPVHQSLRFVLAVPDFEVRTAVARAALPALVDFETAVTASSRAAALIVGLNTADAEILAVALDDVLHVPYRRSLIPGYQHMVTVAIAAGAIGATLSGSGSSIVAVAQEDVAEEVRKAMLDSWKASGINADAFITSVEILGAYSSPANYTNIRR
jgi:homoserine kinase